MQNNAHLSFRMRLRDEAGIAVEMDQPSYAERCKSTILPIEERGDLPPLAERQLRQERP